MLSLEGAEHQHLFGTGSNVLAGAGIVQEQAGGFNHHVGTDFTPLQVGRVALLRQADGFAIHHQVAIFHGHIALEAAMHAVVLEHVGQVVGFEQVVDANHFDVREVLHARAEHHAANAAKTVDTNLDSHSCLYFLDKWR